MNDRFTKPELEAGTVGALLDADGPILKTSARQLLDLVGLTQNEFSNSKLGGYFGAICVLSASGKPTDPETVYSAIKSSSAGPRDLFELRRLRSLNNADVPSFVSRAEELRRLSRLRVLSLFSQELGKDLSADNVDPAVLATKLESFAFSFNANSITDETAQQDVLEIMEDWDSFLQGKHEPILQTGVQILDETIGGFVANLNVIGGLPSIGKSALVATIIRNCLTRGRAIGLFGLEDAVKWLPKRLIARASGLPVASIGSSRLSDYQMESVQRASASVHDLMKNLYVYRKAGIDPATLVHQAKHWIVNKKVKAIFIDHGGEVQHRALVRDRHDLAVAATYRQLRDLAVNHRVPIIVLCHFNRDTDKMHGGIPRLTSFAESEYIARMARVALGLWEHPAQKEQLRCTVLKITEGKRGETIWMRRAERSATIENDGGGAVESEQEKPGKFGNREPKWMD